MREFEPNRIDHSMDRKPRPQVRATREGKAHRLIIVLDNGKHVSSEIATKSMSPTVVALWLEDIAKSVRLHCREEYPNNYDIGA